MNEPTPARLIAPLVHLNGSGRRSLLDGYTAAAQKVREALDALRDTAPNGRDYYPRGASALPRAIAEHDVRIQRLDAVLADLDELAIAVADQD